MIVYDNNAVRRYRALHPSSRATRTYTVAGSGSARRKYTCIFCRDVIDTESARYAMTNHARAAIAEHTCREYLTYCDCTHEACVTDTDREECAQVRLDAAKEREAS